MMPNAFTPAGGLSIQVRLPLTRGARHDGERFHAGGRAEHPGAPAAGKGGHMMANAFTPGRDLVNQSGLPLAGGEA